MEDGDLLENAVHAVMRRKTLRTDFVKLRSPNQSDSSDDLKDQIDELIASNKQHMSSEVSTELMYKWVAEFVREIDMIDNFFVERLQGYVKNFVDL